MKRFLFSLTVGWVALCLATAQVDARGGRGGGGGAGGARGLGGGGRSPSMSRPSVSRPTVSRPSVSHPALASRPSGANRPTTRPATGIGNRPSTGIATRPGGVTESRPGAGIGPGRRPSQGQLQDFLDLPGQPGQLPNRPAPGTRPAPGPRPGGGERPGAGNRPAAGDRPNVGDNARDRWANRNDRPFDRDYWQNRPGHDNRYWHWQNQWHGRPASYWWRPCTWAAIGAWFPWTWSDPYYYNYGTTIVYRDGGVYYGGEQVATADAYYQQADQIAESVPEETDPQKVEWMPLGVFELANGEATADSSMLLQLAVSKEGIIAGTFYNETTGNERPVDGMVDKKTQRAAWKFSDDKSQQTVFETGIYNLTQDETKCLVHFGPDDTQTWTMIRLPAPEGEKSSAAGAPQAPRQF
jgi:hypothetical protein